ncbi:30S ribosomal protein S9 [Candidatus Peregrinibacteria bacterium]|nr:30S ribosomal protein S9 [Candidatus Peregrinibacteria bacterium]
MTTAKKYFYASGKRKTAIAKVQLHEKGTGIVTVNNKPALEYFSIPLYGEKFMSPLKLTNQLKTFDITAQVMGGGSNAQAEALRHGIARALLLFDNSFRLILKKAGYLTRDSRIKERKKYGLKRARRAPQWQKR